METLSVPRRPLVSLEEEIRWQQLWSLAALYASIIIGWIAYENYQPKLLEQFQFTDFAFPLLLVQGLIVIITPMIAGRLGDRYRYQQGHRLPIISTGISFAAMVFMAVAFTLLGNPGEVFKWLLPVLIVLWLVAMSIFTSPALSTMELFTPVDKLPRAMAVLTITGNLVYALEPVIVDIIDYLGAPVTFMLGGVVVFVSGYALKKYSLGLFRQSGDQEKGTPEPEILKSPHLFIFFMGLAVGVATTILFDWFPVLLGEKLGTALNASGTLIVVGVLLFSAVISWPMGNVVNRYGLGRSFWVSLSLIGLTALAAYAMSATVPLVLCTAVFGVAYTSISVASLPLAINRARFSEKVFCVGIFFSGAAVPQGVWEAWTAYSS